MPKTKDQAEIEQDLAERPQEPALFAPTHPHNLLAENPAVTAARHREAARTRAAAEAHLAGMRDAYAEQGQEAYRRPGIVAKVIEPGKPFTAIGAG